MINVNYNHFDGTLSSCPRIQPHVTSCHSHLPQALEDEYGGWMSRKMIDDVTAYADVCFKEFDDGFLHWTTLNEASGFAISVHTILPQTPLVGLHWIGSCYHHRLSLTLPTRVSQCIAVLKLGYRIIVVG
ncbi:putative protein isoform X1 [Capsicum galapagoense]